jgi:hypothetical protein
MNALARLLALVLALASGAAAANVGRVVLAAGETTALRGGQPVRLALGTQVQDRDVLRTGAASNLQVRFDDDSYVSLRENSELRVDEFRFTNGAGKDSAAFSLLKGGLRAVTGLVGRRNNDDYKMVTPTATIGIRGTDYAVTLCQGDCRNADNSPARDGVYGRVIGQSQGTNQVVVQNDAGPPTLLGINSNFFVSDRASPVERLLVAPDFVLSKLESRERGGSKGAAGGSGSEKASSGGATEESRPSTTPEPLPQLQFVVTQDLGPQGGPSVLLGPPNGFAIAFPGKTGFFGDAFFDDDNTIGTFNGQNQLLSATGDGRTASLAGGSIVDTGSYALGNLTLAWGRWTGATSVPLYNGSSYVQTTGVPLLFLTAAGLEKDGTDIVGKLGGVATYSYLGGPSPVDGGGNVGSITNSSTTINFTTLSQTLSLNMSFPSILVGTTNYGPANFSLSGTGGQSFNHGGEFGGSLSGSCSGGGCASASASGDFGTGLGGPNGYDLAVIGGLVHGTQAGEVAFLNLYQSTSFTPGAAPAPPLSAQVAWADPTHGPAGRTFSISSGPNATFSPTSPYYVQSFTNPSACTTGNCFLSAALGPGTVVNQGSTPLPDGGQMYWGRWNGGQITDRVSGTPTTYTPAGGVAFVAGDLAGTLPTGGSFMYSLAGGPLSTNTSGATGSALTQGAFSVSFGANLTVSVATPLQYSIAGSSYSMNSLALVNGTPCTAGVCTVPASQIQSMNFNATCSGSCTSVSNAIGTNIFVGSQASGMAVAGSIQAPAQATSTFAGAFKRP